MNIAIARLKDMVDFLLCALWALRPFDPLI